MRIGLISDTHIPSRRPRLQDEVLAAFKGVDLILHAGDFESLSVADTLEEIAPLYAVSGNMCWGEVRKRYPPKRIIKIEKLTIGLTHGNGGPYGYNSRVTDLFQEDNPDIIVSGHTHIANAKTIDGILFLNPGSPTDKRYAKQNTVLILQVDGSKTSYKFIKIKK